MLCPVDCLTQPYCHNSLKSLNSFPVSLLDPRNFGVIRATPRATAAPVGALPSQSRRARLRPGVVLIVVLLAVVAGLLLLVVPGTLVERDVGSLAAVIFAASYVALAIGRVPGLAIDRPGVALVGASLIVACGAAWWSSSHSAKEAMKLKNENALRLFSLVASILRGNTMQHSMAIESAILLVSAFSLIKANWQFSANRTPYHYRKNSKNSANRLLSSDDFLMSSNLFTAQDEIC
jgi:hypothetical protein